MGNGSNASEKIASPPRILAIEQSTSRGSIALCVPGQQAFLLLKEMQQCGDLNLRDLDLIAVGVGPGAFSGLRMAVAAARALALPRGKEVFAVSSGEALAWHALRTAACAAVMPIGDARRDRIWLARFERQGNFMTATQPWTLLAMKALASEQNIDGLIVTPDGERLAERLRAVLLRGAALHAATMIPTAVMVAQLALEKKQRGLPSEPLAPIYLHPPTSVPPGFPA
jgi:tRNA threonylcarbamoyladenosine biosynthesis protein TsaB